MTLDLNDVQGNIVPGFFKDVQDFLFVRCPDAQSGRDWLAHLCKQPVSSAQDIVPANIAYLADHKTIAPNWWINVAISWQGFERLGTSQRELFPADFKRTPRERADLLGDTYSPAQQAAFAQWAIGGPYTDADALVILGHNSRPELDALEANLGVQPDHNKFGNVELLIRVKGASLDRGLEHFGFKDGISQPVPPPQDLGGWLTGTPDGQIAAPGEFIVGQPEEPHPGAAQSPGPAAPPWASNGSYLVFRRFRQNVNDFKTAMDAQAAVLANQGVAVTGDVLASKMIGRTTAGTALQQDFAADPLGDGCPLFAHIRKANPHDRTTEQPNRHRIIRRGISYTESDTDQGLLFLAYQASIERQFEHIYTRWLAESIFPPPAESLHFQKSMSLSRLETPGVDPLAGQANTPIRDVFYHRPGPGMTRDDFIPLNLPQFVEATATGYFFAPSLTALQTISAGANIPASAAPVAPQPATLVPEGLNAPQPATTPPVQPQGSQAHMPTTYSDLGLLIDRQRPYGGSAGLADLTRVFNMGIAPPHGGANGITDVDVFGALFQFGAAGLGLVPIQVVDKNGTKVVEPVDPTLEKEGIFHIMLPNGEEYRITKGLRVPYTYKAADGVTDIHANILILFNGSGQP
jgi:Dyp-type peroxidase family